MSKLLASAFAALLVAAPSLAIAQATSPTPEAAQTEAKDLTDVRIDIVKNALQLSPEQAKYWPAIEDAIRGRAESRRERLEKFAARMEDARPDRDFIKILQNRADNLSERGAGLKKLADAWQPLYATLSDSQKRRMRILAAVVLHGVRENIEARRMHMEDDDTWGAMTGPGSGESGAGR